MEQNIVLEMRDAASISSESIGVPSTDCSRAVRGSETPTLL